MIVLLIRGGLDVFSFPIFSNRGNLLAASRVLLRCHGTILTLKFCLEHLILAAGSLTSLKGKGTFDRGGCCCCVLINNRRDAAASGVITDGRGCVMLVLILLLTEVGMCSRRERLCMNLLSLDSGTKLAFAVIQHGARGGS
jgi:hypothetical protein